MTNPGAGNLERAHLKRRGRDARDKHEQRAACAGLLWNEREVACIRGHLVRARMLITLAGPSTSPHVERTFGANDGASGVALLMELAGAMPGLEGPVGVDFVLFDGEEYVFGPRDPYFLGSTHFARQYAAGRKAGETSWSYRAGLVLDMVADADLVVYQESKSVSWPDTRPVVDEVWAVAKRMGVRQFVARPGYEVEDDHVPLRNLGKIPTADIIDFDYPPWHTTRDTAAACSGESLEAVGSVVLQWLREQR
jgi:Zn-dependent M28 family amino/carboxypeptidase